MSDYERITWIHKALNAGIYEAEIFKRDKSTVTKPQVCPGHTLIVSIDFDRNDPGPKRLTSKISHLPRPKRPTIKIGRNDPGRNDPRPKRPGFG